MSQTETFGRAGEEKPEFWDLEREAELLTCDHKDKLRAMFVAFEQLVRLGVDKDRAADCAARFSACL